MRAWIVAVACVVVFVASGAEPATKPVASRPATPARWEDTDRFKAINDQLKKAKADYVVAAESHRKFLEDDEELTKLTKALEDTKTRLETARRDGTIRERLDIGAEFTKTKKAVDDRRAQLDASDRSYADAERDLRFVDGLWKAGEFQFLKMLSDRRAAVELKNKQIGDHGDGSLQVGMVGSVGRVEITQVIDGQNAIATLWIYYKSGEIAVETKKGQRTIEEGDYRKVAVWLSGIDTAGKVDGRMQDVPGVFKATKTKTYKTAFGSKTVYLLEPDED